ncbi:MAG: DUF3325 family protein [Bacteroidota bacterium]
MSIVLLFTGCFLLYGKSKYFPEHLAQIGNRIKQHPHISRLAAYALFLLSIFLMVNQLGWSTALVVFFTALSLAYGLLVIVLPLHKSFAYLITGLCVMTIILEMIL